MVTSLAVGGGEMMLMRICLALHKRGWSVVVVSLIGGDDDRLLKRLSLEGIFVRVLVANNFQRSVLNALSWLSDLWRNPPSIIQTWMYHGDLVGSLVSLFIAPLTPIFWSIHNSRIDGLGRLTRFIIRVLAALSAIVPEKIFVCAYSAIRIHHDVGYSQSTMCYLPNGVDLSALPAREISRVRVRTSLGLADSDYCVLWVGRWHADKDFPNFCHAASLIGSEGAADVRFIACGRGIDVHNEALLSSMPRGGKIRLLGPRADAVELMAAADLLVVSSRTEAFPIVILEAMAMGLPCVSTDVGDCRDILSDAGIVAPREDAVALAAAIRAGLNQLSGNDVIAKRCRDRVEHAFSLHQMIDSMESHYFSSFDELRI